LRKKSKAILIGYLQDNLTEFVGEEENKKEKKKEICSCYSSAFFV